MSFGWQGHKVQLVPVEKEKHFENCVRWLNDPEITQWLLMGDFPLTRLAEQEFFERAARPSDTQVVFAIETLEEEHIGMCGLHDVSFRHGTAVVGVVIGRAKLWDKGFGTGAIAILTRYAFDVLGLRLLLADVFAENARSLHVFGKNGFAQVGRIPGRRWKRGAYRDEVLVALRREDWSARS